MFFFLYSIFKNESTLICFYYIIIASYNFLKVTSNYQVIYLSGEYDDSYRAIVSGIVKRTHKLLNSLRPKRVSSLWPVYSNLHNPTKQNKLFN